MSEEHGFYHPIVGYWQTTSEPSKAVQDLYPEGTIPYPLKPGDNCIPKDGAWEYAEPPVDPWPEIVSVLYPVHLWERMTKPEAEAVGAVMKQQDFRTRQIFASASSYRSDHELWLLLKQIATQLFGADRAAQILAPSELIPA
ncbi:hypothetical protein EYC79_13490 [Agrobacterium cavarae]|uniref:Uncharacterized protein n=1 Tax=Agrobacterium cavarae TaxID=2528239 RepID=A0ABY1Y6X1_9HYPH|nr:hypothetical protein [Agrobacterium cavarae]TBN11286.1 hypothetical protein EYC79_13490 [Agrobacterium cavarae]